MNEPRGKGTFAVYALKAGIACEAQVVRGRPEGRVSLGASFKATAHRGQPLEASRPNDRDDEAPGSSLSFDVNSKQTVEEKGTQSITPDSLRRVRWKAFPATVEASRPKPREPRIGPPPGALLHRVASFILPRKHFERIAEPLIDDMREEVYAALAANPPQQAKAWLRRVTYWLAFGVALAELVAMQSLLGIIERAWKLRR